MDLAGPDLSFELHEFKNANHKGGAFRSKEFETCTFVKCNFRDCTFQYCSFRDCVFRACDLGMVKFDGCTFVNCQFDHCELIGINWPESGWAKGRLHEPVHFTECALNHSTFTGLNLRGITIGKCTALDVDFTGCDLTRCDCRGTDFAGSTFMHTNLTQADFRGARNYAIAAASNTLKKTKFSLPEAMSLLYSLDIQLSEE
jgi:fluoroquinolone resistance protein